jgi:hypothetical protein
VANVGGSAVLLIDIRDLAQVIEHAGPLPHPVQDREQ